MLQDGCCGFGPRIRGVNSLFFALLLTVAAPQLSIPVQDLGDFALVPVRDGFLMAWSDGPWIYTEPLDANLQPAGAPFSFPLVVPSSVTSLAAASNGTSVLLTWHEVRAPNAEAQYAAILDLRAKSILAGPLFLQMSTQPAAAAVKNGSYRVVVAGQVWTLDASLGTESVEILPAGAVAALSAAGEVGTAKTTKSSSCSSSGGLNPAMITTRCSFDEAVTFIAPAGRSGFSYQWSTVTMGTQQTLVSSVGSDPQLGPTFLGPNGDGFVGAVVTSAGSSVCVVREGGPAWTVARNLLAVAGNGADVLAVWRDSSGLRAVFLGGDAFRLSDDGGVPKIVPAGSNAFVLLYHRGSSLVAQKVSVQAPRGRAVR